MLALDCLSPHPHTLYSMKEHRDSYSPCTLNLHRLERATLWHHLSLLLGGAQQMELYCGLKQKLG